LNKLPNGWYEKPASLISKKIGYEWVQSGRSAVLVVPSVIVPLEKTFLLNPKHRDFGKIKIKDSGSFVLDQRLR